MTLYMLHTDTATDLIQGGSPALDRRVACATPRDLCISAVTRGELLCGLSGQMLRKKKGRGSKPKTTPRKESVGIDQTMESLRKTTHTVLAALTPREAKALRMRFGIDMGAEHTLENVQRQFDVARERIRLTEQAGLLSRVLDQFLTRVPCLPWDAEAATHFARIAVDLHRSGSPVGSMDTMIAGHALAVGAVLVTSDERHFARVTGLKIENWTRS